MGFVVAEGQVCRVGGCAIGGGGWTRTAAAGSEAWVSLSSAIWRSGVEERPTRAKAGLLRETTMEIGELETRRRRPRRDSGGAMMASAAAFSSGSTDADNELPTSRTARRKSLSTVASGKSPAPRRASRERDDERATRCWNPSRRPPRRSRPRPSRGRSPQRRRSRASLLDASGRAREEDAPTAGGHLERRPRHTFFRQRARARRTFLTRATRANAVSPPPAMSTSPSSPRSFFDGLRRALNSIHRFPYFKDRKIALGRPTNSRPSRALSRPVGSRRISEQRARRVQLKYPSTSRPKIQEKDSFTGGVFSFFLLPKAASLMPRAGCFMRDSCASAASPDSQLTSAMFLCFLKRCSTGACHRRCRSRGLGDRGEIGEEIAAGARLRMLAVVHEVRGHDDLLLHHVREREDGLRPGRASSPRR